MFHKSKAEMDANRERMLSDTSSAVARYAWFFTPFSKFNRPVKVLFGILNFGVGVVDSPSGGGGTGGGPTTTDQIFGGEPTAPASLGGRSISAHGGRRTGTKPRKRCPPGYRWSRRAKRCLHRQDSYEDYRARQTSSW